MKRLLLCLSLATLPACQEDSKVSEDESMEVDENCFTRLHPGKVKGDHLAGVAFQNGRCIGKWKALNKISFQEGVYVASTDVTDFDPATKSKLYLNGDGNVGVKVDGKIVSIGRYTREGPKADLKLRDGVEFRLKIADGSGMRDWTLGDSWYLRDREEILLIVPNL